MNHNRFAIIHHNRVCQKGYWKEEREYGTLLMLIVTEVAKLFDESRLNREEKLADTALRIYDICGKYKIDLKSLPEPFHYDYKEFISCVTNEMENFRTNFKVLPKGHFLKVLLSNCFLYAYKNNIDLKKELIKKSEKLKFIKKKIV